MVNERNHGARRGEAPTPDGLVLPACGTWPNTGLGMSFGCLAQQRLAPDTSAPNRDQAAVT